MLVIDLAVESSQGEPAAAEGTRALAHFVTRAELSISTSREHQDLQTGQKGLELGALSILFDKAVLAPLADLLKGFLIRNRTLSIRLPSHNGDIVVTAENVSVSELTQLLEAVSRVADRS